MVKMSPLVLAIVAFIYAVFLRKISNTQADLDEYIKSHKSSKVSFAWNMAIFNSTKASDLTTYSNYAFGLAAALAGIYYLQWRKLQSCKPTAAAGASY